MLKKEFIVPLSALALMLSGCKHVPESDKEKPTDKPNQQPLNVLFIGIDDLRPELGCYGENHIHSPNIDSLAAQGVRFNRAYVQQAVSAASRASLLTGCYPNTTGVDYPYSDYFKTSFLPKHPSIPRYFYEQGYFTAAMGKIHHGGHFDLKDLSLPYHKRKGYHWKEGYALPENNKLAMTGDGKNKPATERANMPDSSYVDGNLANAAIQTLRTCAQQDKPFFLAVGFQKPHLPFVCPEKYWQLYDRDKISLAEVSALPQNAPEFAIANYELQHYAGKYAANHAPVPDSVAKELIHGYYACVSFVDAQIGKVLQELDRLGLRENTIIVLWSDHGYQLGDQGNWTKHTNYELATRSPLIIAYPGMPHRHVATDALVEYVDIFPTICELTGVTAPDYLEGVSLVPLLNKPDRSWKQAAFSQYPRGQGLEGYTIRTDRYRYVEWRKRDGEIIGTELYDHQKTDVESVSITDKHPELVKALSKKMAAGWRAALPDGIENHSDNPVAPIDNEHASAER